MNEVVSACKGDDYDSIANTDVRRIVEASDFDALVDLYATLKNESANLHAAGKDDTKECKDKDFAIQVCAEWIAEKALRDRGWHKTLVIKHRKL